MAMKLLVVWLCAGGYLGELSSTTPQDSLLHKARQADSLLGCVAGDVSKFVGNLGCVAGDVCYVAFFVGGIVGLCPSCGGRERIRKNLLTTERKVNKRDYYIEDFLTQN